MTQECFTTKRSIVRAFANTMNLIEPEVQNHHEQVALIAWQLASEMGLDERARQMAMAGALVHDIGSVILEKKNTSLADLEMVPGELSKAGASIMKLFPMPSPVAVIVSHSQIPWQTLKKLRNNLRLPQQMGQIIHLADVISLLLNDSESVLNQVAHIKNCVYEMGEKQFHPEVLSAFDKLCGHEAFWMDLLYQSDKYLKYIPQSTHITLDETVMLTEFMSKIIDFRSPFTAMHSAGVAATAVRLAELMGMSEQECKMMQIAGNLHDVGKLRIPNEILEKPGKLTDHEFNIMKEHAYYTYILLKDIDGFEEITQWAAFHHEKLNGAGYPFHLEGKSIPLGSRIMTVADIFSAITEDRPYRKGMEKDKVIQILREDAAKGLLSSIVVNLLVDHFDDINACRERDAKAASKKYQESLGEKDGRLPT